MEDQKILKATCECEFLAAAQGEENASANKTMRINAYNGGLINVGWGKPVGIDVSGVSWRDDNTIPILCLHNSDSIDSICGQSTKITRDGTSLNVEAAFMPVSETAKKIGALAKAGFKFQASVGMSILQVQKLTERDKAELNGSEVSGPCYIVRKGILNEVSIVPLGADGTTNTAIAANKQEKEMPIMAEENKEVTVEANAEAVTIEAAQGAERKRVADVIKVCAGHDEIMAKAVEEGWTADKAELACLRAEKQAAAIAERPAAPSIINLKASAPKDAATIAASACLGAAMSDSDVERQFKGVDLDAAYDVGVNRLHDIFAAFGFDYRVGDIASTTKAIKAAFSSADIPNVLSNVAHKFVKVGFGAVGEDWRKVSRVVPVTDFKEVKGVRLVMGGTLQPLTKGGELKHVELGDNASALKAATKGSIIGITREDLINDDLSVLSTIPQLFGNMAGRTINKDTFGTISRTSSDYGASVSGALNVDNLGAAYAAAMGITDGNGDYLAAMPTTILTTRTNYIAARNIYLSEKMVGGSTKSPSDNPMRNVLEPITSPFLGSGTDYWLFNSLFPLVDVAVLNGRTTPIVETAEADFSQLGIQMRCYFDYGCAKGETKAAVYSTGA